MEFRIYAVLVLHSLFSLRIDAKNITRTAADRVDPSLRFGMAELLFHPRFHGITGRHVLHFGLPVSTLYETFAF